MTEERKRKEIEYYDKKAEEFSRERVSVGADFEGFEPQSLTSFKFLYKLVERYSRDKVILDYGCGNGIHSGFLVESGAEKVIGIDLSEKSLQLAGERIKKEGMEGKIEFIAMDCEKMDFPDNSFDVIFDGGTFSSLDVKNAFPELARVLKPKGFLLGIETFGHNPFTNLKRKINKVLGKRTGWAAEHILKMKDLEMAEEYFNKIEVYYFHLISWLAFPFLGFAGGKALLKFFEFIDKILLKLRFLRKYAFKVVFIFSEARK